MQLRKREQPLEYSLDRQFLLDSKNSAFGEGGRTLDVTRRKEDGERGNDQVRLDSTRGTRFVKSGQILTVDEFLNGLTPKNLTRIKQHTTQGHLNLLAIPGNCISEIESKAKIIAVAPKCTAVMEIFGEGDAQEVFVRVEGINYLITTPLRKEIGCIPGESEKPGQAELIYKLTDECWKYENGATDSVCLQDLFAGKIESFLKVLNDNKLVIPEKTIEEIRQEKIKKLIQYIEQRIKPLQELAYSYEEKNPTESNLILDCIDSITALLTKKGSTSSLSALSQGTDEIFQQTITDLWTELRTVTIKITDALKSSLPEKADPAVIPEMTTLIDSLEKAIPLSSFPASDVIKDQLEEKKEEKQSTVTPSVNSKDVVVIEEKRSLSSIVALSQSAKDKEQKANFAKRKPVNKSKSSLTRAGVWLGLGAFAFAAGLVLSVFFGPVAALAGAAVLTLSLERAKTHYYKAVDANDAFEAEENSKQDKAVKQNDHLAANNKERKVGLAQPKRLLAIQTPPKPNINNSKTKISGSPTVSRAQLSAQIRYSESTPPSSPRESNPSPRSLSPGSSSDRNSGSENADFQPRHRLGMSGSPT